MTAASACGMRATDLATTMAAKITNTANTTRPVIAPSISTPSYLSRDHGFCQTTAVAPSICMTVTCSPGWYTSSSL